MDPSGHAGPQCTARKVRAAQPRRGGVHWQLSGGHAAHDTPAAPGRPPPGTPKAPGHGGRRLCLGEVEPRPLGRVRKPGEPGVSGHRQRPVYAPEVVGWTKGGVRPSTLNTDVPGQLVVPDGSFRNPQYLLQN